MYERRFWPHGRRPPQYLRVWVDNYDEMGEATSYERVKIRARRFGLVSVFGSMSGCCSLDQYLF